MSREITPEEEAFLTAAYWHNETIANRAGEKEYSDAYDRMRSVFRALAESRKPKPEWTHVDMSGHKDRIDYMGNFQIVAPSSLAADLCDWLNATGKKP